MGTIKALAVPNPNTIRALGVPDIKSTHPLGLNRRKNLKDYQNNFYGLKKGEGLDFPKLVRYLQSYAKEEFDYNNFRGSPIRERKAVSRYGVVETGKVINKTIPFNYTNEYKQKIETSIDCGINRRVDYISDVPYFSLFVDFRNRKINCVLSYFYINTEDFRQSVANTTSEKDFIINDKYVGIKFFSDAISDMSNLVRYIQKAEPKKDKSQKENFWYETQVNNKYIPLLENSRSNEELVWLYENAADFTLSALKPESLWDHICKFYNYDTEGTFSPFKDASLQLIRALFAFNTPEKIQFLMKKLNANQEFVKNIYDALDGTMLSEGKEQKLQTVFASLITSLCFADTTTLNFTNEMFTIGKNNYVEVIDSQQEKTKYSLAQVYTHEESYQGGGTTSGSGNLNVTIEKSEFIINLNPLDIVILLQKDTDSLLYVPVLFLKDIDHQKDIDNLMTAIRIGVDILAIALTISTFGGASPLLAVVGAIDIGLAVTDIAVMTNKDELSEEFLKTWEKIYIIGGLATASPLVISSIYKTGGRILASTKATDEMKNFVRSSMIKMVLESEISNFTKNTLKIADEKTIAKASEFFFDKNSFKVFWENGCQLAYGEVKLGSAVKDEIALVYNGVPIIQGSAKEVRPQLMKLFTARHSKPALEVLLENLYKLTPKLDITKKFWTCFNEYGTEMKWLNQQAKTVNLTTDIEKAIKNGGSKGWEGEVAKELSKYDELTSFNNIIKEFKNGKFGNDLGDFDVASNKFLIECKESVSKNIDNKFLIQFDKYLDPKNEKYINMGNKKVVLAIKSFKDNALNLSHPILQQLKNKGVIIITDIKQIKNLK